MATPAAAKRSKGINPPRLHVQVTQADIDEGVRKDSGHCIIAEAVQRAYPSAQWVSVDLATIRITDPQAGMRYFYLTPRVAQEHLVDFDAGVPLERFKPFTFRVSAVQMRSTARNRSTKATLREVNNRSEGDRSGAGVQGKVPVKVGGQSPPTGALSNNKNTGRIRQYGLRGLIR